jgi:ABC-type glycerol-3-phosphate transport system substrate-binding protein
MVNGDNSVNARAPEMDWALTYFPKPADGESITTLGGWNMVIYKNAPNKDAAWKFIEYWTSKEVNEKVSSLTPANIEAAKAFLNEKRRFPDIIFEQLVLALYRQYDFQNTDLLIYSACYAQFSRHEALKVH